MLLSLEKGKIMPNQNRSVAAEEENCGLQLGVQG